MKKIVMKFGGTSVGTGGSIRHVADLVAKYAKDDYRIAVVVSALAGVTNSLLETACQARKSDEKQIENFTTQLLQKHKEAISAAITDKQIQKEVTQITERTLSEQASAMLESLLRNLKTTLSLLASGFQHPLFGAQ
jgi:aspartate kinase